MSRFMTAALVILTTATAPRGAATTASAQTPAPEPSAVVTQGTATLARAPDQAWVSIAVESRQLKAADARREAAASMAAVQKALTSAGLPAEAIRTTSYVLQPDLEWVNGRSRVKGYVVQNQIEARVDRLEILGEVLDSATASGATAIAGLRFDLKDRESVERDALRLAVQQAMARAQSMAEGAGRTLGPIIRIQEQQAMTPMPVMSVMSARAAPEGVPTPVTPGRIEIKATVMLTVAIR